MNEVLQWLPTVIALGVFVVSVLRSPNERANLNGGTLKSYAEAAKTKGEENLALMKENSDLRSENDKLRGQIENRKYRVVVEIETGDKPGVNSSSIEAAVEAFTVLPPIRKRR